MAETPVRRFTLTEFQGWIANANPHALAPGAAQEATNVVFDTPGQIQVRKGMRAVVTENPVTSVPNTILTAFAYLQAQADFVVAELSDGTIRRYRNPT